MEKSLIILSIILAVALISGVSGCKSPITPGPQCPTVSNPPCHSVDGAVGVSGVIVKDPCKCPSDTIYDSQDVITAGGPYNICKCK